MTKYITDVTNQMIRELKLSALFRVCRGAEGIEFLVNAAPEIEKYIAVWTPETIGKLIGSFEVGDVATDSEEIFRRVSFQGNPTAMQRQLAAFFLTVLIRDRLDVNCKASQIVPYAMRIVIEPHA